MDVSGAAQLDIGKDKYYSLDSKTNRRLVGVASITELGDNVSAALQESGTTQYIRDNPFWELRDDIGTLVDAALAAVGGLTINQFECNWRGSFILEMGDKISLTTKDNEKVYSYVLDDVISYDGAFKEKTRWNYSTDEAETETNPTSIGDSLKQTYARVDKANKQIELAVNDIKSNKDNITSLQINANSIAASVEKIEGETSKTLGELNKELSTLT